MDFYQANVISTTPGYPHYNEEAEDRVAYLESKLKVLNSTERQFEILTSLLDRILNKPSKVPQSGWQQFTGNTLYSKHFIEASCLQFHRDSVPGFAWFGLDGEQIGHAKYSGNLSNCPNYPGPVVTLSGAQIGQWHRPMSRWDVQGNVQGLP